MKLSYDKVQYLVEEKGYYFLFFGRDSACMIDGKTLKPDSADKFREFVEEKTGLEWKETTSWLNMSLMAVSYTHLDVYKRQTRHNQCRRCKDSEQAEGSVFRIYLFFHPTG